MSPQGLFCPTSNSKEVHCHTTFAPYEIDIWAEAHVHRYFRETPLHLTALTARQDQKHTRTSDLFVSNWCVFPRHWSVCHFASVVYSFPLIGILENFINTVVRRLSLLNFTRQWLGLACAFQIKSPVIPASCGRPPPPFLDT
jgi:hypothetical protein